MKKIISIFLILLICLFTLTGCSNEKTPSLEDKNMAELEFIEGKLLSILNKIVNDEYVVKATSEQKEEGDDDSEVSEQDDIEWEKLLDDTRKIESAVATTIVDLTALNIEAGEIAKLSNGINNMIIAIDNKDEKTYLIELNNVYSLIPTYMEKYAGNDERTFKKRIKYYAISTYIAYTDGNLEMAKSQSAELEKIYSEKMQDVSYVQNNEYNLNQIYILIQELRRAVESNNSELVKSKYLLIIEEI